MELLSASACLDLNAFPRDPLEKALYGNADVAKLCKLVKFSSDDSADSISEYQLYKKSEAVGKKLQRLLNKLLIYPISSACCERGFSSMNLQLTAIRNRLQIETLNSILMVAVNGPPLQFWQPKKYVVMA